MKKVPTASGDYLAKLHYLSHTLPNRRVWHKAFFKVGPGTGL